MLIVDTHAHVEITLQISTQLQAEVNCKDLPKQLPYKWTTKEMVDGGDVSQTLVYQPPVTAEKIAKRALETCRIG